MRDPPACDFSCTEQHPAGGADSTPAPPATAPQQSVTAPAQTQSEPQTLPAPQMPPAPTAPSPPQLPTTGAVRRLTVEDAEALAHQKQSPDLGVPPARSGLESGHARGRSRRTTQLSTAVLRRLGASREAHDRRRQFECAAPCYDRAAGGLTLSQLITDFGRTNNLVATSALRAKAADMNAAATAYQIKLAVDEAFYNALQTFAEEKVAEQTVSARQLVSDQITTLFQNKLRSEVDVSFANANLAQAKLLLLDAQNNYQSALSQLSQVLGYSGQQHFELRRHRS